MNRVRRRKASTCFIMESSPLTLRRILKLLLLIVEDIGVVLDKFILKYVDANME